MKRKTFAKKVCDKIASILDRNFVDYEGSRFHDEDYEEIETMINAYVQRLKRERQKSPEVANGA